ncbi:MAG: hypothetical protein M2R45_03172 [Verrucomicrobia subdivision 3 bacterium]|nr:hypothetical protein [Limisphaerales bacterium]MCS1417753.1 hypothetical protein [Limisphaerales bacterium]
MTDAMGLHRGGAEEKGRSDERAGRDEWRSCGHGARREEQFPND